MISTHLALLRGVNVGGKNRLPMQSVTEMFVQAGCTGVRTFIQSGNVIFRAPHQMLDGLAGRISKHIENGFGYRIPVVLRTSAELGDIVVNNPFSQAGADEKTLHVYFLATQPNAPDAAELDPNRSPPDSFVLRNREIYVHLPNGMGRTKLSNTYFDSKLATTSTARNWRTVLKLYELMAHPPSAPQ